MLAKTLTTTQADLSDARLCAEVEAWLAARPDSTPFHRPAWINAVARGNGQQALMLVARRAGGEIEGVLPLNLIHSPLFGRALVSTGFAVDGGILADDIQSVEALAQACWTLAERLSCPTAELRGGALPASGWQLKSDAYLGFRAPIPSDDEGILKMMEKRHRASLRKAFDFGLVVEYRRDVAAIDIFYRLYCQNVHRLGTPVFPKALFTQVMAAFGDAADIAVCFEKGEPVTAVLSLYHNGACMPYWSGANMRSRALFSVDLTHYQLMRRVRDEGCTIFDFGRSKVGTGPAKWKKTWGFTPEPLIYAQRAAPGREPRDINPLSPQYQRKVELWKKLPLSVANLVGPHIARGLG